MTLSRNTNLYEYRQKLDSLEPRVQRAIDAAVGDVRERLEIAGIDTVNDDRLEELVGAIIYYIERSQENKK